jgi:hypothetical protein
LNAPPRDVSSLRPALYTPVKSGDLRFPRNREGGLCIADFFPCRRQQLAWGDAWQDVAIDRQIDIDILASIWHYSSASIKP